jgi:2-oxoglutarate dehydrogenase E2 component (dihydrolipoamide succinyltransferase)
VSPETLVDVVMPDSEGTESVIAAWFKSPGDRIAKHEPIAEVSTDKVTVEVPAPVDGVLEEILKPANADVAAGDVLARVRPGDAAGNGAGETPAAAGSAPDAGGDAGRSATGSETAPPATGTARRTAPVATAARPAPPADRGPMADRLSPAVRRLVRQHDLDVTRIEGSGRGGRVTVADIERFLERGGVATPLDRRATHPAAAGSTASPAGEPHVYRAPETDTRVPHTPMRKGIADHMVRSMATAPHVTSVMDADLTRVLAHREAHRASVEAKGTRLTLTAYFVVAAVDALRTVPEVNSRWHDDAIELLADCNVGIATAVEAGLIVPVIRKAQDLDLFGVAGRLTEITARARKGRLDLDEVQNGTFTITNHGGGGSLIATPIINQPQSAIMGVGRVEKRVVVREVDGVDTIQIRPMVYLTMTIDHRVLDGFTSNRFLSRVVEVLESWPA